MHPSSLPPRCNRFLPWRVVSAGGMSLLLFMSQTAPLLGNPTGGNVVAGSATIGAAGPTLTVNQGTQSAIINWQTFSIASGETTKFIVPNSSSATLNRVTGGNPSAIYGNLQSNGILYLVNPSGIVVGPSGRIDTAGFLASTLDVSNEQFLAGGDLNFSGSSGASVNNAGVIHASSGDVYLIANQVNNTGKITAPKGTAGLAAGSDILFQQAGNEHLFVQATPTGTTRATGVTNAGTIRAAAAELKAAGGNAYALAINNTGVIAATGYKKINGQVYLTSDGGSITNSGKISARQHNGNGGKIVVDGTATTSTTSGTVTNSGTLNASATRAGGTGGTISVKDMTGKTVHSGAIVAKGGQGGTGGSAEVSGGTVSFTGTVDLTAAGGKTGTLLLDPTSLDVIEGFGGNIINNENDPSMSTIGASTVDTALDTANITLNADNSITIDSAILWGGNTLTLSTNNAGSTITINAALGGGGLVLNAAGFNDVITGAGDIEVGTFTLQNGSFVQNQAQSAPNNGFLTIFSAGTFNLEGSSSFLRIVAGSGTTGDPYQIADIYGLQGLGSPSGAYLGSHAVITKDIDPITDAGYENFIPIGTTSFPFIGSIDGQGHTINQLTVTEPGSDDVGLFTALGAGASITNLSLTNVSISGDGNVGALAGENLGATVSHVLVSGTVTGEVDNIGGLIGNNMSGALSNISVSAAVSGADNLGGVAGYNDDSIMLAISTGSVTGTGSTIGGVVGENDSDATVTSSTATGTIFGASVNVGGLIGYNRGLVQTSFASGAVSADSGAVGGLVGENDNINGSISTIEDSYSIGSVTGMGSHPVGGLVGVNFGTLTDCYSTGPLSGSSVIGGITPLSNGTVTGCFWDTTTTGTTFSQGGLGEATSALLDLTTYTQQGWDFGTSGTDLNHTWVIFNGQTRPLLSAAYSTTITDAHQLQLIGLNAATLGATYTVANDIDLSGITNPSDVWGTSTSNGGEGFVPIGSDTGFGTGPAFTGTFNGANFALNNLYINRVTSGYVGLFGEIAPGAMVQNVALTDAQVKADNTAGALVGMDNGTVSDSYATGAITGRASIGGLVGYNEGTITLSASSVTVTSTGPAPNGLGGLVGYNNTGTVTQSYATGAVTVTGANSFDVGGFAGANDGMIADAYSTGNVTTGTGSSSVGGFVGINNTGTIVDAYSVGTVTVGGTSMNFGAFAGVNNNTITNGFYDTDVTGSLAGVGDDTGTAALTGATTNELTSEQFVDDNSPASPTFDFESIWTTSGDTTTPTLVNAPVVPGSSLSSGGSGMDTLSGIAFEGDGTTADGGSLVNLIINGTVFGSTTTDSSGDFTFTVNSTELTGGVLLTDTTTFGNTYYQANTPTSVIANVNIVGGTLTVMADAASNAALAAASAGSGANGINYTVNNANNLATIEGVSMNIVGGYQFDGNITSTGSFTTSVSSNLTSSRDVTLTGGFVTLSGSLASTAAVNLTSTIGDVVIINLGNSTQATAASMTLTSAGAVSMGSSTISLAGGDFVATGQGSSSDFNGIDMQAVNLITNGGNINLTGQGILGNIQGLNVAGLGIDIANSVLETAPQFEGEVVHAAVHTAFLPGNETPTTGNITMNGNGSPGAGVAVTGSLTGVHIDDTTLSVIDGAISITGTVSNGTAATFADGVTVDNFSAVEATGIGTISITGTTLGATASTNVTGVHILNAAVTAVDDSGQALSGINIMGTAGALANEQTRAGAVGIYAFTDTTISATGTAPITLTGFGGTDTDTTLSLNAFSNGILFTSQDEGSTSLISTTSGAITLTGTGGISPRFSAGLNLYGPNEATAEVSSTSGAITLDGSIANVPNNTLGIFGDYFQVGSVVATDSGLITIDGTVHHGSATQTQGQSQGVVFSTATIQATGTGSIMVTGDTTGVTGNYQIGGVLAVDTDISTVGGDITINGTTNTTSEVGDELFGINLRGATSVLALDGSITMTGTVSSGTADVRDFGIRVSEGATLEADGEVGNVTLTGTTAGSTSDEVNMGFIVEGAGSFVNASGSNGLMITGTSGALGGTTGGIVDTSGDNVFYNPGTYGIAVADGGALNTLHFAPMTLHGTGGANTNSDATSGSSGVAVFSPVAESTTIVSAGTLNITGNAGSSPGSGFGVLIGGAGNVGNVNVTATGDLTITGTGGSGNVDGSILPNGGVGIFNPGNNSGSAEVNSTGGNVAITGTSGGGTDSTGLDLSAYFSEGNDDANASVVEAGGTITFDSLSGAVSTSAGLGGTAVSFTTPVGTSSTVWISEGAPVSLSGGDYSVLVNGEDVSLGTISVSSLTLNSPGGENHPNLSFGLTNAGSITLNGIGEVNQTGAVTTSLLTINNAETINLLNPDNAIDTLGDISSSGLINLMTDPGLTLTGTVTSGDTITLAQSGGPLTLGPNAQVIETGTANIILAAGTSLATANNFINNSTFGATAIQPGFGALYIYSSAPTSDVFGGLTFAADHQIFGAIFPQSSNNFDLPGNAAFYFTGTGNNPPPPPPPYNPPPDNGSTPPPSTMTGGAAGGGSNIVPPALTPQSPQVAQANDQTGGSASTTDNSGTQTPPVSFVGTGIASLIGQLDVGLADATSNGGQISSGDIAQLGGGALTNVSNPEASDQINEALGPIVYQNLSDALKAMGDWADVPDETDNTASGSGGGETILTEGGVAEMTGSGVKDIPLDQAPVALRNAMNGDILKGAGH